MSSSMASTQHQVSMPTKESRIQGAIVGVAVADALGGSVAFLGPGQFEEVTGMMPISRFRQPTGSWSDDTSMTLCIVQSLLDNGGEFVARDLVKKFWRWLSTGYMSSNATYSWDVGDSTRISLNLWSVIYNGPGALPTDARFGARFSQVLGEPELNTPLSMGNGSLMRVAPIGAFFHSSLEKATVLAHFQSALTHPPPVCGQACAVYIALMHLCFKENNTKAKMAEELSGMISSIDDETLRQRLSMRVAKGWDEFSAEDLQSSGWVTDTLDCALWAFFTTSTWKEGALRVVNLGGDADTAGAIYGGLAGAFYGLEAVPQDWRNTIVRSAFVHDLAARLAALHNDL